MANVICYEKTQAVRKPPTFVCQDYRDCNFTWSSIFNIILQSHLV